MLLDTNTTIVLFCPSCGGLSWHVLSLFPFNKQKKSFICDCNTMVLTVEKRKDYYCFTTGCSYCETTHTHSFTRKEILSDRIHEFYCSEIEGCIGYMGPKNKLKQHVGKRQPTFADLALEFDSVGYFENPTVMLGILEKVYDLMRADEFRCTCGNKQLEIEILPDQLELICPECSREYFIPAMEVADLNTFELNAFLPQEGFGGNGIKRKRRDQKRIKSNIE